ncbi:helicase, partial [Linderina macrospora]
QRVMAEYTKPEIQRTPLEQVCLQAKALGYADSQKFLDCAISPPDKSAVVAAEKLLVAVGASTKVNGALTALGKYLGNIPADLRLAKMLVYGAVFGILDHILVIVSLMASDKPLFSAPHEKRAVAKEKRMAFATGHSDWLADVDAFEKCSKDGRRACTDNFVSFTTMRDVKSNIRMLRDAIRDTGLIETAETAKPPPVAETQMLVKAIVFAGLSTNIVRVRLPQQKYQEMIAGTISVEHEARQVSFHLVDTLNEAETDWQKYDMRHDSRVFIHPQSTLFAENTYPVPFLAYFSQSSNNPQKVYLRDVTMPGLYALLMFGPDLVVDHENKVIVVGCGGISVRAWPRIAVLVNHLKMLLDELLRRKLDDPALEIRHHPVVTTILKLIATDGV